MPWRPSTGSATAGKAESPVSRFPLRVQLACVALALLLLPWAGWRYVTQMESFLLQAQEEALLSTARAVATALHERPQLLDYRAAGESRLRQEAEQELRRLGSVEPGPDKPGTERGTTGEIAAILRGLEKTTSRIWVVSRDLRVLAVAGSLKSEGGATGETEGAIAAGRELASALQGAATTRVRNSGDERIVSAAHPIWQRDQVLGAVLVEEAPSGLAALRSQALERLMLATLLVFAAVAGLLLWFAARLSSRIRRLSDEAEAAIDFQGRVSGLTTASGAGDEIGELSRRFNQVLQRLSGYNAYLESLASRLSHELRTPLAVVRSSLENLHGAHDATETARYVARAEEGLGRLSMILSRMTEASRLEQGLSTAQRERFDAAAVIRGCVEGYRLAYATRTFELEVSERELWCLGAPDLLAQMLDKLAENAVDFAAEGTAVRIRVDASGDHWRLRVENDGPPLPEGMHDALFESMVSVRTGSADAQPHLGLGLYVARLIAAFHAGRLVAANLPSGRGVAFEATFPRAL